MGHVSTLHITVRCWASIIL